MADASQYTSRRASAAAAAEAHSIVPINSKSTRKRKEAAEGDAEGTNRTRGVRTPRRAPPASRLLDDRGRLALLQTHGEIDADEAYGEQEKALSEFLRLHPMLSLCAILLNPTPPPLLARHDAQENCHQHQWRVEKD